MKLEGLSNIKKLEFDIPGRKLFVFHEGTSDEIESAIETLDLGGKKESSEDAVEITHTENKSQRKVLIIILVINFLFFIIEIISGLISNSMGLVADSLDMLADSFVYGISLMAVGSSLIRKKRIARMAGYFQITLAVMGFVEVLRRFFGVEVLPDFSTMLIVSFLALIANSISLYVMRRAKSKEEAHIKASLIFTSNDVIINLGVIVAALMIKYIGSGLPDLIIGAIVFVIVIRGALRILKL